MVKRGDGLSGRLAEAFRLNLALARQKANLTQDQLAEKLDLSRSAVNAWEVGRAFPEFDRLMQLPAALGVELAWLFGEGFHEMPRPTQEDLIASKVAELLQDLLGLNSTSLVRESPGHIVTGGNGMPIDERALDRLAEEISTRLGKDFRDLNQSIRLLIQKLPSVPRQPTQRRHQKAYDKTPPPNRPAG